MNHVRIQLSRAKGWRMPAGAVKIDRATKWGNPHRVEPVINRGRYAPGRRAAIEEKRKLEAVAKFEIDLRSGRLGVTVDDVRRELRGKVLACWCRVGATCHGDVLLRIANEVLEVKR
jgi:hypothetical protein